MKTKISNQPQYEPRGYGVIRDYTESFAMAIMLAFLFRMFLLEAFVIPTGSMAPTLHGRHMDVKCPECDYQYQTGASSENVDNVHRKFVVEADCPLCGYPMTLDKEGDPNQRSFMGDRILVSKFSYAVTEPERWEVIVFKFPGNAKQNYIKRLVGLPGERIRIAGGDIYAMAPGETDPANYQIVRKPPRKLLAMLQLVHDSDHVSESLEEVAWPSRWQAWSPGGKPAEGVWTTMANRTSYQAQGKGDQASFLRYRHYLPSRNDWADLPAAVDRINREGSEGKLITDYYAYNHGSVADEDPVDPLDVERLTGFHWVGDLAAEFEVEVQGETGEVLLDLVEGGTHFQCAIDIQTGQATLSRTLANGDQGRFDNSTGIAVDRPVAPTPVKGPGSYRLRFSNVDNELLLWVNNKLISFDDPTTYTVEKFITPHWHPEDPGDLAPVGIGVRSASLQVHRMRVYRDVYYVALSSAAHPATDYLSDENVPAKLADYRNWENTSFFSQRVEQEIPGPGTSMGPDDFLPMGDNSPESSDGRMWPISVPGQKHTVHRDLLIGEAMFVYWPHSWRIGGMPILPNFKQMRMIR